MSGNSLQHRLFTLCAARTALLMPLLAFTLFLTGALPARAAIAAARVPATAQASAQLAVNPATVSPGGQLVIDGSGFGPGEIVLIRFNGTLLSSASTDPSGNFSGSIIAVPNVTTTGTYSVSASGTVSGHVATVGVYVAAPLPPVARVSVNPAQLMAGAGMTIAGTGFTPGETVILYFHGQVIQGISADNAGSFIYRGFAVPQGTTTGHYTVIAVGATSGRGARTTVSIQPVPVARAAQVFLNAPAAMPGAHLVVSGRGFQPGEIILLHVDGTQVVTVAANYAGDFSAGIAVSHVYGKHMLSVTGTRSGRTATTSFFTVHPIRPGIGLLPNWAYPGAVAHVNGTSFVPREIVLIYFRGRLVQAVTADRNGRFFRASFKVPAGTPLGYAPIRLLGSVSGRATTALLRVTQPAPRKPVVLVSAATPQRGATVLLHGSGFAGKEIVLVRYRGSLVEAFTTDSHGTFAHVRVHIPANSPYGTAAISLLGTRSHLAAHVQVKVTAPRRAAVVVTHHPKLAATPTNGVHHQATMTVWGSGFAPGEKVRMYLHGKLVLEVKADSRGNLPRSHFTVALAVPAGNTTLQAVGTHSGRKAQVRVLVY